MVNGDIKKSPYVFVYGTLRQGESNERVMAQAGGLFLFPMRTYPTYTMYSLGYFPAVARKGHTEILGELWKVDTLKPLDYLEGHPTFYERKLDKFPNFRYPVWVYRMDNIEKPHTSVVESGIWHRKSS